MTKKTWIGAAALLAVVIVVLAVVVAVANRPGDETETGQSPAPTASTAPSTGAPTQEGEVAADVMGRAVVLARHPAGDPLPQTSEPGDFPAGNEPVDTPSGLTMQRLPSGGTILLSSSDGPTGRQGAALIGYARSARGAALLSADYLGRGLGLGQPYIEFLRYYVPDSRQMSNAEMSEMAGGDRAVELGEFARTGTTAPSWFKFQGCSSDFCTVSMASHSIRETVGEIDTPDHLDAHAVLRVSWRWSDDRWELVDVANQTVTEIDPTWEKWL